MNGSSLSKVKTYIIDKVLGGKEPENGDARSARLAMLEMIATDPDRFLSMARDRMTRSPDGPGAWVMGAVHTFYDANISIDDPDKAARHIMEAIKKRFKDEMPVSV